MNGGADTGAATSTDQEAGRRAGAGRVSAPAHWHAADGGRAPGGQRSATPAPSHHLTHKPAAVQVLGVTDDLVAVGKPPSLPVHASGPFRKNSVAGVLQAEAPGLGPLRPVHRLDNSVSGVLLLARSAPAAHALNARIQARGAARAAAL